MKLSSFFSACALLLFLSTAAVATSTDPYRTYSYRHPLVVEGERSYTDQELEYLRPYKHIDTYDAWYSWVEFGLVQSLTSVNADTTSVNADTIHQELQEVRRKREQEFVYPPRLRPFPTKMLAAALSVNENVMTEIVERADKDTIDQTKSLGYKGPHQMDTLLELVLNKGKDPSEQELIRNAIKEARWEIHLEKDQIKRAELEKFFIKKEKDYPKRRLAKELDLLLREMEDEMRDQKDKKMDERSRRWCLRSRMKHDKLDYDTVKSLQVLLVQATDVYKEETRTEQKKDEDESKIYTLIDQLMEQLEVNVGCSTALCKLPRLLCGSLMRREKYDVIKQWMDKLLMDKLILLPEREKKGNMTPGELEIWCNKLCMTELSRTRATLPPRPTEIAQTKRTFKKESDFFIARALRNYDDDERMITLLRDRLKEHRVSEFEIQEAMQVARRTNNVKTAINAKKFYAAMKYLEDGGRLEETWTQELLGLYNLDLSWCKELVRILRRLWLEPVVADHLRLFDVDLHWHQEVVQNLEQRWLRMRQTPEEIRVELVRILRRLWLDPVVADHLRRLDADLHWHQELVQKLERHWLRTGQRPEIRVLSISLDTLCVTLEEDGKFKCFTLEEDGEFMCVTLEEDGEPTCGTLEIVAKEN